MYVSDDLDGTPSFQLERPLSSKGEGPEEVGVTIRLSDCTVVPGILINILTALIDTSQYRQECSCHIGTSLNMLCNSPHRYSRSLRK